MSAITEAITALVQQAPARDPAIVKRLLDALAAEASPLARSIAAVVELVDANTIDPAIALPALAMACATLTDERFGAREHEAARFEIETLLPLPASAPKPRPIAAPDVPLVALGRKRD